MDQNYNVIDYSLSNYNVDNIGKPFYVNIEYTS
jgi:hypothetical protein